MIRRMTIHRKWQLSRALDFPNPPAFGIYVKHPLAAVEQKLAKEFNLTSLIEASPANQRKPISDVSKLFGTIQQNSNFLRLSSVT